MKMKGGPDMASLTTLCYIEQDGKYLMLHRVKKEHDINKDKWIGVGGHFEKDESPYECLTREVLEETGCTLDHIDLRGIVTFISGGEDMEYMFLYTASGLNGTLIECDEGEFAWVDKKDISGLDIWEGDRIFFRLLEERDDFFDLKLVYDGSENLISAVLDGDELIH